MTKEDNTKQQEPQHSEWTNFRFFGNQVYLGTAESKSTGKPYHFADCRFIPGSKCGGIDLGNHNGIAGRMRVFLSDKQYQNALDQKADGKQVHIGLPASQLNDDGKVRIDFYEKENPEASERVHVDPIKASAANNQGKDAYKKRQESPERGQEMAQGIKEKAAEIAAQKDGNVVGKDDPVREGDAR